MDCIFIEGMLVTTRVGIYPRERVASQTLEIDMAFGLLDAAASRDDIADTISYDQVADRIRVVLGERQFNLLETLGDFLAKLMLEEFRAPWVRISIVKPGILRDVRRVGVYIERGQDGVEIPAARNCLPGFR
jgi:7,8-dihydroneopterin aldolase/epimerase/oxygenase